MTKSLPPQEVFQYFAHLFHGQTLIPYSDYCPNRDWDYPEVERRRSSSGAKPVVKPGPSSAAGGKALPSNTIAQYKMIPETNKASARAYLKKQGYDISGLE